MNVCKIKYNIKNIIETITLMKKKNTLVSSANESDYLNETNDGVDSFLDQEQKEASNNNIRQSNVSRRSAV